MRHVNSKGEDLTEEVKVANKAAMVEAMVTEALGDEVYCEALFCAAFNMVGFRSLTHSVPLDDLIAHVRRIAECAREYAARQVLQ